MSTAFYNPNGAEVPPVGVLPKQGSTNVGCDLNACFSSHLLSPSDPNNGNLAPVLTEASDDELISAAQLGDQRAFMELCDRYSGLTKQKISNIVRNREDTEDALQDTLLRAYAHLTSFRRSCKFSTWLTAIGINSALMILRRRRGCKEISASPTCPDGETMILQEPADRSLGPEGNYLKQQTIFLVRRELRKLTPKIRSIVDYYYRAECSLQEVAKEHEISLSAAKSRLVRGRDGLRSSLAMQGLSKLDN
jgi:RNA polymerase sigma-70 factor (ECF subfamily)